MATLLQVKTKQPEWFSKGNRRFFNDVSYSVLHGKVSHKPFLVRATYAWTDMLGEPRKLHYRINLLEDDLVIGQLVAEEFATLEAVKLWLADN